MRLRGCELYPMISMSIMTSLVLALFLSSTAFAFTLRMNAGIPTVAIFGCTGALGRECVYQALSSGFNVVGLARTPSKMNVPDRAVGGGALLLDSRLTVIQGDVTNAADVNKVFDTIGAGGNKCVGTIVALGGKTKDVGPTMLTDGTTNIVKAMKSHDAGKRIAVVTSIGAGDSENQAPLVFKALMYTVMRSIFADKNAQEQLFLSANAIGHDLDWCIVRPGGLGIGPPTGVINVIDGQAGSIMRADVASFCLGAILDEGFKVTLCPFSFLPFSGFSLERLFIGCGLCRNPSQLRYITAF